MKSFSIILAFVYCVIGVLSVDKCARGPTYWCSSIKSAKECNAVKHCTGTVWANTKVKSDTGELCQWCTELVEKAHQMVADKKTQDEVLHLLEQGCTSIPIPEISTECKDAVDRYVPEIFDMLVAKLDPQVICTALDLCNRNTSSPIKVPILKDPSTYCDDCKKFLNDVKEMVSKSKDDLLNALNQICDQFPPDISGLCHQAAAQYIEQIYNFILTQVDPNEVCPAIGFCPASDHNSIKSIFEIIVRTNSLDKLSAIKSYTTSPVNDYCDDCVKFFNDVKEVLANNKSSEQFLQLLNNLCDALGSEVSSMCHALAQEYYLVVYDYLVNQLDSKRVCYIIQFCKSQTGKVNAPTLQQLPLKRMDIVLPKPSADIQCVLCEYVIHQLDTMLADNKTEEAIKAALDRVCDLLPKTIAQQCTEFIDEYAEGILVLLAQELDPDMVCTALGLCSSVTSKPTGPTTTESNLPCDVCTMMIQALDKQLLDNATQQEITYMVDKICFIIPSQMKTQCLSIINTYGPYLIQMLASVINPELICQELGICKTPTGHVELLGRNKCLFGPSYWCKDKTSAKACKAEEHCRRHVWKN